VSGRPPKKGSIVGEPIKPKKKEPIEPKICSELNIK